MVISRDKISLIFSLRSASTGCLVELRTSKADRPFSFYKEILTCYLLIEGIYYMFTEEAPHMENNDGVAAVVMWI